MYGAVVPKVCRTEETNPQKGFIEGDVFLVPEELMEDLDRLEQHPKWYKREVIDIDVKGRIMKAWCYLNETTEEPFREPMKRDENGIYSF